MKMSRSCGHCPPRGFFVKNLSFIGGKWRRIPGSTRAEDVCWDRQGHRRVVCTSYTILNNAQATQSTSIQCPEEKYIQYTVHSSLYSHKTPLKLNFFDAPAIPVPDYYSNPLIHVAHVAYMCTLENVFPEFEHGSHV